MANFLKSERQIAGSPGYAQWRFAVADPSKIISIFIEGLRCPFMKDELEEVCKGLCDRSTVCEDQFRIAKEQSEVCLHIMGMHDNIFSGKMMFCGLICKIENKRKLEEYVRGNTNKPEFLRENQMYFQFVAGESAPNDPLVRGIVRPLDIDVKKFQENLSNLDDLFLPLPQKKGLFERHSDVSHVPKHTWGTVARDKLDVVTHLHDSDHSVVNINLWDGRTIRGELVSSDVRDTFSRGEDVDLDECSVRLLLNAVEQVIRLNEPMLTWHYSDEAQGPIYRLWEVTNIVQ